MLKSIKKWLKKTSPFGFSKNHRYDILTKRILKKYCTTESNCIDVGCHEGELLDLFLKICPHGHHFAFEPIPYLYNNLLSRYRNFPNCRIYDYALSNNEGTAAFNHVITNPAYSGLKKRKYDRENEKDETLIVTKKTLDDVIPADIKIDFIKIDVEGGEVDIMLGAKTLIQTYNPLIVFEFGIGGSDVYGATPEKLYSFMNDMGYDISLLDAFLKENPPLTIQKFIEEFNNKVNYYFIAHPKLKVSIHTPKTNSNDK